MADTRILLIRHGQHDPQGRHTQHTCAGLTTIGQQQAAALAARLAGDGSLHVHAVLASRAARALQTAEIVADAWGLSVGESTCDLCEMHPGEAEGLTYDEMCERFGPNLSYVPGGEYFPDWLPGATRRLHRIAETYRGETVVALTHNSVHKASFVAFGRMPPREAEPIQTDNTGITEWVCMLHDERRRGVWRLERHNDTAHLVGRAEPAVPPVPARCHTTS